MIFIGEWTLAQEVARFRRELVVSMHDWWPGPPELSTQLFDGLRYVWLEAKAEVLGYCMEQYPGDPGSKQAAYLLAGLLRTRMDSEIGDRRIAALSTLAGVDNVRARKLQLLRELPGAVCIAWDDGGPAGGISALRDRAARIIEVAGKDAVNREARRRVDPTESVDETLDLRSGKTKKDPEQDLGDDVALSLTPERSAEELPGIQLFQTQEAVRQDLEERIKRYGFTKKEAEVIRLMFEDKETHEIAATMGIKEKTVWVHQHNIRQKACGAGG